jgi:hypothetical protein
MIHSCVKLAFPIHQDNFLITHDLFEYSTNVPKQTSLPVIAPGREALEFTFRQPGVLPDRPFFSS